MQQSRVIIFGLGGVGSWCAEALIRSGIGSISLVDSDLVEPSNINRQAQALNSTLGRPKTEALAERLKDINPLCKIEIFSRFFAKENAADFGITNADYVIDAIDTLPHKIDLIEASTNSGKKFFSSMGMAKRLDPTLVKTADIWKTGGCPLARIVRQELKKRNFSGNFTVVYSTERVHGLSELPRNDNNGKKALGSAVPVTATAGMVLASLVLRDVCSHFKAAASG